MFLLKKIISSLLMPLPIFLLIMAAGLYLLHRRRYRQAKGFFLFGVLWIGLLAYPPIGSLLIAPLEGRYPKWQDRNVSIRYIHVLGSGHVSDARLPLSSQPYPSGLARDVEGMRLHRLYPQAKLIFSGYEIEDPVANAVINTRLALALGVPARDIVTLPGPRDTAEEAQAAKEIVGSAPMILVTSASHMPRAVSLFRSAGLHVLPAPTDYHFKKVIDWFQWPNSAGLQMSEIAFHEYLGLLWHWILTQVQADNPASTQNPNSQLITKN